MLIKLKLIPSSKLGSRDGLPLEKTWTMVSVWYIIFQIDEHAPHLKFLALGDRREIYIAQRATTLIINFPPQSRARMVLR